MTTLEPGLGPDEAPILGELRVRYEAADSAVDKTVLRIRQALYLARTHRLPEAEGLPAEVRGQWGDQGDNHQALRVHVWLWVLEGVLAFYRTSGSVGRTRLLQAHAAADRMGWRAERELSAAWLAHLAYVDNDYVGLLRWLPAAGLGTAALDESAARSALTLACALQWFGHDALGARWFGRAREVARRTGDRAGIMAATANRTMLRLHDNWLAFVFSERLPHDIDALRQELNAILGYEQLSGSASLQEQNEIARVRMSVMRGDDSQAHVQLARMAAAMERGSAGPLAMAAVIDAWLLGRQATPPDAQAALRRAEVAFAQAEASLDADDQASCRALMAQLARRAGEAEHAQGLLAHAQGQRSQVWSAFEPHRTALLALESEASAHWPGA
jgi:hypothetical protein